MTARTVLNKIWASSVTAQRTPFTDVKYSLGWVAEIPTFQNINFIYNKWDTNLLALAERGFFSHSTDIVYRQRALCYQDSTNKIYVALVNNPIGTPSTSPTQWAESIASISRADYDDLRNDIDFHIADVTTNPHDVTALQAGAVPSTGGTYSGTVVHTRINLGTVGSVWTAGTSLNFGKDNTSFFEAATAAPFWNTATTREELLVDSTALQALKDNEHLFAIPTSNLYLPLSSDVHMYEGFGTAVYTNFFGSGYTDITGVFRPSSNETDKLPITWYGIQMVDDSSGTGDKLELPLGFMASTNWTFSMKARVEVGQAADIGIYFGAVNQIRLGVGGAIAAMNGAAGAIGTFTPKNDGIEHKVVVVLNATHLTFFLDDVQLDQVARTGIIPITLAGVIRANAPATARGSIRDVKIFNQAITFDQLSRL